MKTFLHLLLGGVIGGLLVAYLGSNGYMGRYSFITQGEGSSISDCGNNKVDKPIEQCDNGRRNNGVACSPQPNQSCSYCSNDCKIVKVDGSG